MVELMSKAEMKTPEQGDVALFRYEKQGLDHVAVVEYVFDDNSVLISEANYDAGRVTIRHIPTDYPHLVGFYATV